MFGSQLLLELVDAIFEFKKLHLLMDQVRPGLAYAVVVGMNSWA